MKSFAARVEKSVAVFIPQFCSLSKWTLAFWFCPKPTWISIGLTSERAKSQDLCAPLSSTHADRHRHAQHMLSLLGTQTLCCVLGNHANHMEAAGGTNFSGWSWLRTSHRRFPAGSGLFQPSSLPILRTIELLERRLMCIHYPWSCQRPLPTCQDSSWGRVYSRSRSIFVETSFCKSLGCTLPVLASLFWNPNFWKLW